MYITIDIEICIFLCILAKFKGLSYDHHCTPFCNAHLYTRNGYSMCSCASTRSGLYGTRPVAANPACILFWCNATCLACLYNSRNSCLSIWLTPRPISCSTRRPYDCLRTEKQPTSNGCNRCDECAGIQRTTISSPGELSICESSESNVGPTSNQIPGASTRAIIGWREVAAYNAAECHSPILMSKRGSERMMQIGRM